MTATLTTSMCMTSFGFQSWDPSEARQNWRWEDWDDDGVYECYYYKDNGNRGFNLGTTSDGYEVNQAGQWIVNGVVQTRTKEASVQETAEETASQVQIDYSAYDPAHPLANVIDAWDLRLVETNYETGTMGTTALISSWNVHAMLTGQMDQYYMPPVGYSTDELGNSIYTTETAYANNLKYENDLYNWYCNWLNGMDFQHMTEMERAKEIQKVLASASYVEGTAGNYSYGILIDKQGQCTDFAMTARALAKAMGLKSGVSGNATHSWYYIQIDGKVYSGENQYLNLNNPVNDFVYLQ